MRAHAAPSRRGMPCLGAVGCLSPPPPGGAGSRQILRPRFPPHPMKTRRRPAHAGRVARRPLFKLRRNISPCILINCQELHAFPSRTSLHLYRAIEMKQAVGLVGWRGMVGSVLMQRMRDENDFALIEPVFSPPATLAAPRPPGPMARARCRTPTTSTLSKTAHHHYRAGWRLHLRDLPEAARRGLERHLDRRRQHPAHGR